jgi:hypothetical protein
VRTLPSRRIRCFEWFAATDRFYVPGVPTALFKGNCSLVSSSDGIGHDEHTVVGKERHIGTFHAVNRPVGIGAIVHRTGVFVNEAEVAATKR